MGYGLKLKLARVKRNLTQAELANMVGITGQTISYYEREQREPRLGTIVSIAQALDADITELFFKED